VNLYEEARPSSLRWRGRTFGLLVAAGILLVVGVVLRNPTPLFLALPLLLAPVAAALSAPRTDPRARLDWKEEGSGAEVRVTGTVRPDVSRQVGELVVDLPTPPSLVEVASTVRELRDGAVAFRATWRAPEPMIALVPAPSVVWRDPAGLVERPVDGVAGDLVVSRYPPELLRLGSAHLDRTTVLPGETRSRRIGASGEFFGIRDADPDEHPRRINWRASARAGRLLANEYALERTGDVVLLLDARPTELGLRVDERLLSITRAAAEGVAQSFLRVKSRVGAAVYGEFLEAIPLSTGRGHSIRLRDAFLRAHLAETPGPSERCAVAMRRYYPPGVTTILFSSLADDSALSLVSHIRRRGYRVVVLSPSPLPLLGGRGRLSPADEELAGRLTRLMRRSQVARAWQEAPAIDWEEYGSLGGFVEFLRRPASRRVS
jgi:uncharacterized protein (DUF58 family)